MYLKFDTEQAFGVGTINLLHPTRSFDPKGGGNLPPPFGQFRVTTAQVFNIALGLNRISQHPHHINDGKPPLIVMPSAPDGGLLKYGDVIFWRWFFGNWLTLADWFSREAQRELHHSSVFGKTACAP